MVMIKDLEIGNYVLINKEAFGKIVSIQNDVALCDFRNFRNNSHGREYFLLSIVQQFDLQTYLEQGGDLLC